MPKFTAPPKNMPESQPTPPPVKPAAPPIPTATASAAPPAIPPPMSATPPPVIPASQIATAQLHQPPALSNAAAKPPTTSLSIGGPILKVATWIREKDEPYFQPIFAENPRIQLCNARIEPCDMGQVYGLLLTGGSDISAPFLKQPIPDPSLIRNPDPARDEWEFKATNEAIKAQIPIFAICRGMQVLNVALGGTLHLDIPGHDTMPDANQQQLRFAPKTSYKFPAVNSSHHQAIYMLGALLSVEAWSIGDDIIEQIRMHPYVYGMGVQYHPERDPNYYHQLFKDFCAAVIAHHVWKKR
jgi:putative glutamine amidotransferase